MAAVPAEKPEPFAAARELFSTVESYLMSKDARNQTHSELERELEKRGLELMRTLLQAHLDVRGPGEAVGPVAGCDGVPREQKRVHERGLETIFGEVQVQRLGYGAEGADSLHPLDAYLNLPAELYSHEVRHRVAEQVAGGSFAATVKHLHDHTGAHVGRRQVEELAARAAQDFDRFYEEREGDATRAADRSGSIVVISADQKGVVMRRQDLRCFRREHGRRARPVFHQRRLAEEVAAPDQREHALAAILADQHDLHLPRQQDVERVPRLVGGDNDALLGVRARAHVPRQALQIAVAQLREQRDASQYRRGGHDGRSIYRWGGAPPQWRAARPHPRGAASSTPRTLRPSVAPA